jgi:hypothetical protein
LLQVGWHPTVKNTFLCDVPKNRKIEILKVQDFTDPTRLLLVYIRRVSEELVVSVLRVAKEGGTI